MREYSLRTHEREHLVEITGQVAEAVGDSAVTEGVALVYCAHTTAGVTVNENADPDVARDLIETLRRMVPRDAGYRHREGNADSHVKASLMGSSVSVPVTGGRLALGTWQGVFFCEFEGPRSRHFAVQVVPA